MLRESEILFRDPSERAEKRVRLWINDEGFSLVLRRRQATIISVDKSLMGYYGDFAPILRGPRDILTNDSL